VKKILTFLLILSPFFVMVTVVWIINRKL